MSTLVAEHAVIHVAFLTCLLVLPLQHVYNADDKAEPCSEDLCDLLGAGGNHPMNPPSIITQNRR